MSTPKTLKILFILLLPALIVLGSCKQKKSTQGSSGISSIFRKRLLSGVEVTGISLLSYPKYSGNGESWDPMAPFSSNPDIYCSILWNSSVLYKSEVREDQEFGAAVLFTQGLPAQIKPFDQPLTFELFDEDGITADDNMGYIAFRPMDFEGKETVILESGAIKVELKMKWNYTE